jgi:Mg-chelatase subunit ChlD
MEYVPGSGSPRPAQEGTTLVWRLPALPAQGATLSYQVRPRLEGRRATNVRAEARYQAGGADGAFLFPVPHVLVVSEMPSPTPTLTPTPTATATPTATPTASPTGQTPPTPPAGRRYLPAVFARACAPTGRPADIVVVLDASTTMGGPTADGRPKIEAAKEGALELARLLTARGKRVGLVSFNSRASELAALGTDPAAFGAGLARVSIAEGSRIDLGLEQAAAVLRDGAAQRVGGAGLFVLLVSDGQPAGAGPAQVVAAADALRGAGARVSAVAVGTDADLDLLRRVAGEGDVWHAGDGEGFRGAAVSVVGRLDCR